MVGLNNNHESFKLLDISPESDVVSDVPEIISPPKKKKLRKRLKNVGPPRYQKGTSCQCSARTISLSLFCVVLVCWLVTLTWLAVVLHREIMQLRLDVTNAVAGNQGVSEALQHCHSLSRSLQKNQSQIMERLTAFDLLLSNFSLEMSDLKTGLRSVQDQLKSSPDLNSNPRMVKDLFASVASFGSQIKDLNSTVLKMKEHSAQLDEGLAGLTVNVTGNAARVAELSSLSSAASTFTANDFAAEKAMMMAVVQQVATNLTVVNDTLSNKLKWNVEDQSKNHKLLESLQEMSQNVTARVKTLEAMHVRPPVEVKGPKTSEAPVPSFPSVGGYLEPKQNAPTAWTLPFSVSSTASQEILRSTLNSSNVAEEMDKKPRTPP